MATESGQSNFSRGIMSLVILSHLKREDMYGYQLVQETERVSGGRIVTQEGSLYPVLYKLVDQGLISDRRVQVGKRMTRVYYHLEPEGEQRLAQLIHEYEQVTQGVFQIIKEADGCASGSAYPAVSVECVPDAAGEAETERSDPFPGGRLRPGLCY